MAVMDDRKKRPEIRAFRQEDAASVMELWLKSNLEAHDFISGQYWREQFDFVKAALPQAEVFVWEAADSGEILGFLGLSGDYIAGIFVESRARSCGIGKRLLEYAKEHRERLNLHVYQKNERAVRFYQREGVRISSGCLDEDTREPEYEMVWRQG